MNRWNHYIWYGGATSEYFHFHFNMYVWHGMTLWNYLFSTYFELEELDLRTEMLLRVWGYYNKSSSGKFEV